MSSPPTAKPTLYYVLESPPCQTVLATARLAGIDLNLKEIDYGNNEHNQEHFVKINPLRCVPALVDEDGFALNESRAIAIAMAPANTDGLLDKSMEQMKVYVETVKSKMINKFN